MRGRLVATLVSLLLAAPAVAPATETTMDIASPQNAAAPRPEPARHHLVFSVRGGDRYDADVSQMTTVLRLDLAGSRATMALNRHNGDLIGQPIGLFGGALPQAAVGELAAAVEGTAWGGLPQPERGDVTAPTLALDYLHGTLMIQRQFNARNASFLQAIAPVMQSLQTLTGSLLAQPQRTLLVEAQARAQGNQALLTLVLRNTGSGPILLSDPRHGARSAWLRIALLEPTPPGTMEIPPQWTDVPVAASGDRRGLLLAAGQSLAVEAPPWPLPETGGRFLVQAVFEDYAGPPLAGMAVLPFCPDPDRLDASPYLIRGAAFSSYQRLDVPPR